MNSGADAQLGHSRLAICDQLNHGRHLGLAAASWQHLVALLGIIPFKWSAEQDTHLAIPYSLKFETFQVLRPVLGTSLGVANRLAGAPSVGRLPPRSAWGWPGQMGRRCTHCSVLLPPSASTLAASKGPLLELHAISGNCW